MVAAAVGLWRWRAAPGRAPAATGAPAAGPPDAPAGRQPVATRARRVLEPTVGTRFRAAPGVVATVTGQVVDAGTGAPVAGVDVVFAQGSRETTATSDGAGRFSLSLAPGVYDVRAIGDGVIAPSQPPLAVARAEQAVAVTVQVVRTAAVRGRVVYDGGAAAAGAEVAIRSDSRAAAGYVRAGMLAPALADAAGAYELVVPPGAVELRATTADGAHGFARVEVAAGEVAAGVDIVVDRSASVAGVVRAPDGFGLDDATVVVSTRVPRSVHYDRREAPVGPGGRFEVRGLRPGRTVVEAVADGYAPSAPVTIDLAHGEARTGVVLTVSEPLVIAGRVVDADGVPVPGAEVAQVWLGSKLRYDKVTTDGSGAFAFDAVGPGPHMIRARHPAYVDARQTNVMAPVDDLVLKMVPAGSIRGRVRAAGGEPVPAFSVDVRPRGKRGGRKRRRFATGDGRFEIWPVAPGDYDVIATADGFAEARARVSVEPAEPADVDVELSRQ